MAKDKLSKQFEEDVQSVLTQMKRRLWLSFVRLYDTKSARGNFLPEQPGDFIVAAHGAHLLECKTSEIWDSLAEGKCLDDNVSSEQAAEHRIWAKAGNPCWFLFYSQPVGCIELWRGADVGEAYAKRQLLERPATVVKSSELYDLLLGLFGNPVAYRDNN